MSGPALRVQVLRVGLALMAAGLGAAPGCSAPRDQVDLFLTLDARGSAEVALQFEFPPPRAGLLAQRVGQALGAPLERPRWAAEGGAWTLYGHCDGAFHRHGLEVERRVDPAPLVRWLRPLGVQWLTVNITHPRAGFSRCPGAQPGKESRGSTVDYFYPVPVTGSAPALRLVFGYHRAAALQRAGALLALLLLPIGLIGWQRRSALRATGADPAVVWFRFARLLRYVGIGAIPVWAAAVLGLQAEELAAFALGRTSGEWGVTFGAALILLPPVLVLVVCSFLSQQVYARLRGTEWTRRELAGRSMWPLVVGIVPLLLALAGLDAGLQGQPRSMVLYIVAAWLCRSLLLREGTRVLGMTPEALATGELRDRIFELASQAKVRVQQIYILPAGKGRMANAFAMRGNQVLITDYLIQHLSKREVDAIMAHELTHLQRRDPGKLWSALLLFLALPVIVMGGVSSLTDFKGSAWAIPVLFVLAFLGYYCVSRRRERGADAGAVALTGDAEALITGLAKVSSLSLMPLQWGKWDERFLTHPSTLRRVQAIAAQSGISPERLQEILASLPVDTDRYELPPTPAGGERLFSTSFKTRVLTTTGWALTAVVVLTPALTAYLVSAANIDGVSRLAIEIGGLAITLALVLLASGTVPLWGFRGLHRRLRDRLAREGLRPEEGRFAGFAPTPTPRVYEGFTAWDVGFLWIEAGRLCYVGEQTRFALRRDHVAAIALGPAWPGWWRVPGIVITWRDEACGTGGTFALRPTDAASLWQLAREARSFAKQLQAWRERPPAPGAHGSPVPELDLPTLGEVTSVSPSALFSLRAFERRLFMIMLLAVATGVLLGLPFAPDQGGLAWYGIGAAAVGLLFQWWPCLVYRERGREANGCEGFFTPVDAAMERETSAQR